MIITWYLLWSLAPRPWFGSSLVSSPDQNFRAPPADSSKNSTFTVKTGACLHMAVSKIGVFVGVNYIFQLPAAFALPPKNLQAGHICDDTYLSNLIGATCRYAHDYGPVYQWMCPDPIFWQGRRVHAKNLVSGDKTNLVGLSHIFVTSSLWLVLFPVLHHSYRRGGLGMRLAFDCLQYLEAHACMVVQCWASLALRPTGYNHHLKNWPDRKYS